MTKKRRGHGEGSVRKLPGGGWEASITLPSTGDGVQRKRRSVRRTQALALDAVKDMQREAGAGVEPGRVTMASHLAHWVERQERSEKDPQTTSQYRWAANTYLVPSFGGVVVGKLQPAHVDSMLAAMAKTGKSRRTMALVRSILSMAMNDAMTRRLVTWNPVAATKVPKPSRAAQQRAQAKQEKQRNYRPEQETALVEAARGDRLEALWLAMLWAGLRPGEVTGLTWQCVDLDAGLLRVHRARRQTPDGPVLGPPKGGDEGPSKRTIELPAPLVAALRAHKTNQTKEKMKHRDIWPNSDLVFTTRLGTMIDRRNLERLFSALAERAGLGADWHPHEARHLYVSQLVDDGLSITEVSDAVGHARGSRTTAQVYSHRMRDAAGSGAKAVIEARHGK